MVRRRCEHCYYRYVPVVTMLTKRLMIAISASTTHTPSSPTVSSDYSISNNRLVRSYATPGRFNSLTILIAHVPVKYHSGFRYPGSQSATFSPCYGSQLYTYTRNRTFCSPTIMATTPSFSRPRVQNILVTTFFPRSCSYIYPAIKQTIRAPGVSGRRGGGS